MRYYDEQDIPPAELADLLESDLARAKDKYALSDPDEQAWQPTYLGNVRLGEVGSDGFRRSWILYLPVGKFKHPEYGRLDFSRQKLAELKRKFDDRVRGIDIALDCDHKEGGAPGWIEAMELRGATASQPAGLYALIRWTPLGVQLLKDQSYRYFSPEFGSHYDEVTGRKIANVALGGALTNRPFLKVMGEVPLSLSEEEARMYDLEFADQEDEEEEESDEEGSDPFDVVPEAGEEAPIYDADAAHDLQWRQNEELGAAILARAEEYARTRHPGYSLKQLSNAEQSAILSVAAEELGYRGAFITPEPHADDFVSGDSTFWPGDSNKGPELSERADDRAVALAERIARQRHHGRHLQDLPQRDADSILSEAAEKSGYQGAETQRFAAPASWRRQDAADEAPLPRNLSARRNERVKRGGVTQESRMAGAQYRALADDTEDDQTLAQRLNQIGRHIAAERYGKKVSELSHGERAALTAELAMNAAQVRRS